MSIVTRLHLARVIALVLAFGFLVASEFSLWGFVAFVLIYVIGMLIEQSLDEVDPERAAARAKERS